MSELSTAEVAGTSWRERLRHAALASPVYRMMLSGPAPSGIRVPLAGGWPGEAERADAIFQGRYRFAGREARAPNQPPWRLRPDDAAWSMALHSFDWLPDFSATGAEAARDHVRRLVRSWVDSCSDWEPLSWAPAITGRRLINWLVHFDLVLAQSDTAYRDVVLESAGRQARHLARTWDSAPPGRPRLDAVLGLIYAGLCLEGGDSWLTLGVDRLENELLEQVRPDGGHISRSPRLQAEILADLIVLRAAFEMAKRTAPVAMVVAIERMAAMLRAFRHGDGHLALFQDADEGQAARLDSILNAAVGKGKPVRNAEQTGYQRAQARRALLLLDCGPPPATLPQAHLAPLGFEFSIGARRFLTNCGSGHARSDAWQQAARTVAAHNCLSIEGQEAVPVDAQGRAQAFQIECRRREDEQGRVWLDAQHNGYAGRFGLTHYRRLFLSETGQDLRGEDSLQGVGPGSTGKAVAVRFHLHPGVQASAVQGGAAVLLKLGDGQGWRFRAAGGEVSLEESVYLGRLSETRRSQQIVLRATLGDDDLSLKWALRKSV